MPVLVGRDLHTAAGVGRLQREVGARERGVEAVGDIGARVAVLHRVRHLGRTDADLDGRVRRGRPRAGESDVAALRRRLGHDDVVRPGHGAVAGGDERDVAVVGRTALREEACDALRVGVERGEELRRGRR